MQKIFVLILFPIFLFASFVLHDGENFELSVDENISFESIMIDTAATFQAREDSVILIEKEWVNQGEFFPSTSLVQFTSPKTTTISGNNTFYNFYASNKSIIFESNTTQEITNKIDLTGVEITSTIPEIQSILNLATVTSIITDNLEIQDSKIIGRFAAINPLSSQDNGNNIFWFSDMRDCTNIGSGHDWFEKVECSGGILEYIIPQENTTSKVSFDKSIAVSTMIEESDTGRKVTFLHQNKSDVCTKQATIMIEDTGAIVSGYQGCGASDPTLENWEQFTHNTQVFLLNTQTQSTIVVDLNMSTQITIGGI